MSRGRLAALAALAFCAGQGAAACEGRPIDAPGVYEAPVCAPAEPRRVVVLDASFALGIGLDVGLPVVGAPLARMSDAGLRERAAAAGVESIGGVDAPSLETIVALQPDLIVGFPGDPALAAMIHPQVSQIAPTLLFADLDWRAFHFLLADLTGRAEETAARFAEYDARLADVRARMPDTTVSVLRITSWDFQVYLDAPVAYAPFEIMRQVGVRRTAYETTDDPGLSMKRPDWEGLAALDGDVLLYIIGGTNASDRDGRMEEVLGDPLWAMLPAVATGRVHRIDHGPWMEFNGLASAHRVLDDIERYVIAE